MENKRINWIDWAKVIGIMIVVFCHIPQYDTIEKRFLCSFQMPLFFMLSGYLHKSPDSVKFSFKKYWKTIIIPYILFQILFYPYFLVQRHFESGLVVSDYKNSILIPLLDSIIGIPINGVTWFLVALLIIKIIVDFFNQYIHIETLSICGIIISIIVACFFFSDGKVHISYAISSMFNFMPFFFLGIYLKYKGKFISNNNSMTHNFILCLFFLFINIGLVLYNPDTHILGRFQFYLTGVFGSFFIIFLCRCISVSYNFITTLSRGTIVIFGLHWMFIGTTNFILEHFLNIGDIKYSTFEATLLVLIFTFILYFIILFCQKYFKSLLGGR